MQEQTKTPSFLSNLYRWLAAPSSREQYAWLGVAFGALALLYVATILEFGLSLAGFHPPIGTLQMILFVGVPVAVGVGGTIATRRYDSLGFVPGSAGQ